MGRRKAKGGGRDGLVPPPEYLSFDPAEWPGETLWAKRAVWEAEVLAWLAVHREANRRGTGVDWLEMLREMYRVRQWVREREPRR